jgi:competence ComEA-like helix-hairpin-helix protein
MTTGTWLRNLIVLCVEAAKRLEMYVCTISCTFHCFALCTIKFLGEKCGLKHWLAGICLLFLPFSLSGASVQDSSSTEWIKVYFNMPADHSVALPGNMSKSRQDLIGTLETLIQTATHSVDLAIYDLEHPRIGQALAEAGKRGVDVRIVTDNYNRTDAGEIDSTMWATLRQGGITSIDDDGDIYRTDGSIADHLLTNSGADMHHKFAVIDAKNDTPDDDHVWTGSTNLTFTGAYNSNNVIIIKDSGIAKAYLKEFEQMWGSGGEMPDAQKARYHKDKKEVGDHTFFVDDTKVEVYFSPINRTGVKPSTSERIVEVIREQVQHDIAFQAFAITPDIPPSRAIWDMSANGDIRLHGIIDPLFYYRYRSNGDIWASTAAKTSNRLILPANEMRKLHHKVMLLDAAHTDPADRAVTIGGSYNFSKNAERNNDENLLIIYSDRITNQFYQDFRGAMRRAQEQSDPPAPPLDPERWYPVEQVSDGSTFLIEVVPGFEYEVEFLGVDVPRIYAGNDSSEFYSSEASDYLRNLISGGDVKLEGPWGSKPQTSYGAFQAYVTLKKDTVIISLNRQLLQYGFGQYESYHAQHPDSVAAFKKYARQAEENKQGIWRHPENIGTKYLRAEMLSEGANPSEAFPININTADQALLELLPGIGPVYARRIIEYRQLNGGFNNIGQLRQINGIGPKTMQKLRPNVITGN